MNNYKENECSCKVCQSMCKTPCIGTPIEMGAILVAGFRDRLSLTGWAYGKIVGTHSEIIPIIAPEFDEKRNCCTFFKDGKCELHSLGLKPMEGRYANHNYTPVDKLEDLFETPLYKCIEQWEIFNKIKNG